MKFLPTLAISALVFGAPPMVSDLLPSALGDNGAAYAKDNSNKARGNRGAGSANRNANAGRPATAGSGRPATAGSGRPAHAGSGSRGGDHSTGARPDKPRNVHAQLKGLNSLNRNINGLMNSSDPKMDLFREFVMAGADHEQALAAFPDILDSFDADGSFATLLEGIGLDMPMTADGFDGLKAQLNAILLAPKPDTSDFDSDAAYQAALTTWQDATDDAAMALGQYQGSELATAVMDITESGEASSEAAMIDAMVAGLNATGAGPVAVEDMSPEMIEWVASQMGVGDSDGFIDAYLAQLADMATEAETDG